MKFETSSCNSGEHSLCSGRITALFEITWGNHPWSLTLREERMLHLFENRVLKRVFGSKMDEVTGEWRKLHNEELRDLYSPILCGW